LIEPGYIKTEIVESSIVNSRLSPEISARMHSLYKRFYASTGAAESSKKQDVFNGSDPVVVSRAITDALTSRNPRTRYVVGAAGGGWLSASLLAWVVWILPDRVQDWIIGCF
jgi:hypothetical protein